MYEIVKIKNVIISENQDYLEHIPINWLKVEFELSNGMLYMAWFRKDIGESMPTDVNIFPLVYRLFPNIFGEDRKKLEDKYELPDEIIENLSNILLSDKNIKLKAFFLKETDINMLILLAKNIRKI